MKQQSKIRIMLVDDHFAMLAGLRAILKPEPDMEVVAEASDGLQAVEQYRVSKPDITLMDLRLPHLGGVEAIQRILKEFPDTRIIALTTFEGDEDIHRAMAAGAKSFLNKSMPRQETLAAIRHLHRGEPYLPESVKMRLEVRGNRAELSPRELEVLNQLACGLSNKEMATALGIAEITVKIHVGHVLKKLGVLDRLQAVVEGLRHGIIHLE